MSNPIFNCDEKLVELINYALDDDEYSFRLNKDSIFYTDVCKEIEEDKHKLFLRMGNAHINITVSYDMGCDDSVNYNKPIERFQNYKIDMHIQFAPRIFKYEIFNLSYYIPSSYSKNSFIMDLNTFRTKPKISFFAFMPKIEIHTDSSFTDYNNEFKFGVSDITDCKNNNIYSNDGEKIYYDSYSKNEVSLSKGQVGFLNPTSDANKVRDFISKNCPQYDSKVIYDSIEEIFKDYKKHHIDLYNRLKEAKEAIKNRDTMLESRKDAPFFSNEKLNEIIDTIKSNKHNNYIYVKR